MWLRWGGLGTCVLLSACTAPNNTSWWDELGSVASSHHSNKFSFEWQLVGDQSIAPHHIFSSNEQVWMLYPAVQSPPVVTQVGDLKKQPLILGQQGSYWVVNSSAKALRFQHGAQLAWAYLAEARYLVQPEIEVALKQSEASLGVDTTSPDALLTQHVPILHTALAESTIAVSNQTPEPVAIPKPANTDFAVREASSLATEASAVEVANTTLERMSYKALVKDQNLRQVLHRWAKNSNWTFEAEHWAVDVDLPITADFHIHGDFSEAVQALVASTWLGSHPLKPCFYSNQVLRIIRGAQRCAPKVLAEEGALT